MQAGDASRHRENERTQNETRRRDMKDIPEEYVLVKATTQSTTVSANGEAFSKTLQFLWNPDEHIKTGSLEFVPPRPIDLSVEHMMPVPAKIADFDFGILNIAQAYKPSGRLRVDIPFVAHTLPPGEPIPAPKKTLDTYSRLEGQYRILISHPNVCVNQSTDTPQKLTMCVYLNENFMPGSWGWVKEPEPPLRTHEKTSEAMLLILDAAQVIGVDLSQTRVANLVFTVQKGQETFIAGDLSRTTLEDFVFTIEDAPAA